MKYLIFLVLVVFIGLSSCSLYKLCPIPGCQVRMLHAHQGVTFRGQPWWRPKKMNPKVGEQYVYTKDNNLIKKKFWWQKDKPNAEDKEGKKSSQLAGIKARDPNKRHKEKNLEVEPQEEDKDEGY